MHPVGNTSPPAAVGDAEECGVYGCQLILGAAGVLPLWVGNATEVPPVDSPTVSPVDPTIGTLGAAENDCNAANEDTASCCCAAAAAVFAAAAAESDMRAA